jgi:hypothetical protein
LGKLVKKSCLFPANSGGTIPVGWLSSEAIQKDYNFLHLDGKILDLSEQ